MKYFKLLFFILSGSIAFGQTFNYVTEQEYANLKLNGLLTGNEVLLSEGMVKVDPNDVYVEYTIAPTKAQGCGGYFDPPGPSLPLTASDDGWASASPFALPFTFCFFGDSYTQVWMNNNGNISFTGGISSYSSNAFPSAGNVMIAPFWADFDFGGIGTMHATITPTAAIFNWVGAGYFSSQVDKINTCQVVITDGTDPLVLSGNAAIHYADMQWTTGSASSGVNGFGGIPATAGANRGNNIDYFQIGQFDHEGVDYDGPAGLTDGVSWLDNKSFFFDFCTLAGGNIEPIPLQTAYCDTFKVCSVGDTLDISFPFLSPENNQITSVSYSSPTLTNVAILSNVPGVNGEITIQIYGDQEPIGVHEIIITATDNFSTPGVTTLSYWVEVVDGALAFPITPVLDYVSQCAPVTFGVLNGPYDSYIWETGDTSSSININNYFYDTLSVTVENNGCKFTIDSLVYVPFGVNFSVLSSFEYCAEDNGVLVQIGDSAVLNMTSWGLGNQALDTAYSNILTAGTYTIYGSDEFGLCSGDTTFTITENQGPNSIDLLGGEEYCIGTGGSLVWIADSALMNSVTWGIPDPALDTVYSNYFIAGTYNVTVTSAINGCAHDTTFTVIEYPGPSIFTDTFACNFGHYVTGTESFTGWVGWSASDTAVHFGPNASVENPEIWTYGQSGVYTVNFTDSACNITLSAQIDFLEYPGTWLVDTTLCNGITYVVEAPDNNPHPTIFTWSNGTSGTNLVVNEPGGTFIVTMSNVCHNNYDTITVDYKLCDINAPNVLSLAQGSQNSLWYVNAEGLGEFSLFITNRWGNVIYECNDSQAKCYWDGRNKNGVFVEEGTYFYTIVAKTESNSPLEKHGFIQVVD